jgi:hypothetical protein
VLYKRLRAILVDISGMQLTQSLNKFLNYVINLKMENLSSIHGMGKRPFFKSKTSRLARSPPTLTFNGHLGFVLRAEVADVRSDQLPPPTTDIKNECSYTSTPLFAFMTYSYTGTVLR